QDRNGVYFQADKNKPYTGEIVSYVNGITEFEGQLENGFKTGTWTYFYPNGQKKMEGSYKDGQKEGNWISWKINGQQEKMEIFKTGKIMTADGRLVDPNEVAAEPAVQEQTEPVEASVGGPSNTKPVKSTVVRKSAAEKSAPVVRETPTPQPVAWQRLRGGPVKTLDGIPYTGPVVKYQSNGEKELDGYFDNGRKTGKWNYYDKRGNLKNSKYY
ncbi:MAG TPA: hypothetical protein VLR52_04980, partial [Bacteroidales bacterium]|nr:hypothetical protein [Bacteroidales bacterium]